MAAAAKAPVEIRVLTFDAELFGGKTRIERAAEAFMAHNPHVSIKIDLQCPGDSSAFMAKLDLFQLSGETADVIQVKNLAALLPRAEKGFFKPLDDFLANEGITYDATYSYPAKINGKQYGIPFILAFWAIYINKDMLDAANLPPPQLGWTWDDYARYAKAMTKGEGANKIYGSFMHNWAESKRTGLSNAIIDNPYIKSDGTSNLDNPLFEQWLQFIWKLEQQDKSQTPYAEVITSNLHYRDMFMHGKAAMIPMGSWMIDTVLDTVKYPHTWKTIVAPYPIFGGGTAGVTPGGPSYFAIGANSRGAQAQTAYEFIRFITDTGAQTINILPSTKNCDFSAVLAKKLEGKAQLLDADSLLAIWNAENFKINITSRDIGLFVAIDKVYNNQAELFLLGSQSAQKTMVAVKKKLESIKPGAAKSN